MGDKYAMLPLPTDTEAETSFDLEKSFKDISKKAENSTTKRRSMFNVSVQSVRKPEEVRKSTEFKSAELKVNKEIKEWREVYMELRTELKKAREKRLIIDVSILPEEKRKFLQEEPDIDRYLRTLHDFQSKATRFLKNEFMDMMNLREHVNVLCKHEIQTAKGIKQEELYCSEDII